MKRFVIIDGHAIIHRAYHAIPPMNTKDGTIVNAVFGFSSMLLKAIEELQPEYLAVSFDVAGGTFRDELYEEYKATRQKADQDLYDQIPFVYDVVRSFNIPIYEKKGFEADDIIGTITSDTSLRDSVDEIVIVTGDKDLLQLVDEKVTVYLLKKGLSQTDLVNPDGVKQIFGFGPEHVVDYKAIRGDSSDNIPGIKGVGDKGAKNLIDQFGSLESIYKQIKKIEKEDKKHQVEVLKKHKIGKSVFEKILQGEEQAKMSKELATIKRDVKNIGFKLKETELHNFDLKKVEDLFKKFEFFSLLKRIPGASVEKTSSKKKRQKAVDIEVVETKESANKLVKKITENKWYICKEIVSGQDIHTAQLEGFVCQAAEEVYFVKNSAIEAFFSVFDQDDVLLIGHDLKQIIKVAKKYNCTFSNQLFDIMIASYVINSSTRAHDLSSIVMRELGTELPVGREQGNLFGIDPTVAGAELGYIYNIYSLFKPKLEEMADSGLFRDVEMALIPVLAEMEFNGISVDTEELHKMSESVAQTIQSLTKNIYKEAGEEFNISSSVQLREILFEKMELPTQGIKKGKTGYSTAASELEKLREYSPIIGLIEEFREVEKLRNTYIDVLPTLINKKTQRIHTTFNQAVAATGRLSSSDPNLQNIPIRTELGKKIRSAFIAEKGNVLVAADYSQIELRIVASLAKDRTMIDVFQQGEDIHKATAAKINGVPLGKVTKEMRRAAKEVNFGVLYGMGAFGLSSRTGIPQWQAKEFIDKYFQEFDGVKQYMDKTLEMAKRDGYVETLFGRRRYIPELKSDNYQIRSSGERMAINMPVQGTAADLMKMAMIEVYTSVQKKEGVKMLLQVHDELVLEVKKGLEDEIVELLVKKMEEVVQLDVPVLVEAHIGKRWGELK